MRSARQATYAHNRVPVPVPRPGFRSRSASCRLAISARKDADRASVFTWAFLSWASTVGCSSCAFGGRASSTSKAVMG